MQIHELLRLSLNKGITSKPGTNHLGAGLWLISHYVTFAGGELMLFSEGASCHQKKNNFKMGQCGFWKGTIVYLKMPLLHKAAIAAGKAELNKQYNHVKLAFV